MEINNLNKFIRNTGIKKFMKFNNIVFTESVINNHIEKISGMIIDNRVPEMQWLPLINIYLNGYIDGNKIGYEDGLRDHEGDF